MYLTELFILHLNGQSNEFPNKGYYPVKQLFNKILLFLSVKSNQGLLKSIQLIKQKQQQ